MVFFFSGIDDRLPILSRIRCSSYIEIESLSGVDNIT